MHDTIICIGLRFLKTILIEKVLKILKDFVGS